MLGMRRERSDQWEKTDRLALDPGRYRKTRIYTINLSSWPLPSARNGFLFMRMTMTLNFHLLRLAHAGVGLGLILSIARMPEMLEVSSTAGGPGP